MATRMGFQHVVPDEHLKLIGDITVSFAFLENAFENISHILLGTEGRLGPIVTAELSFKALRALAASLYLEKNGEDENYEEFRELLKRAASVEEQRNQYTHSRWGAGTDPASITRIKTTAKEKHGVRFTFENITLKQLRELSLEIKFLIHDVFHFPFMLVQANSPEHP